MIWFKFIVFWFFKTTTVKTDEICSKISSNQSIIWPETKNASYSEPLCINNEKAPVVRQCVNGEWEAEPQCFTIQPQQYPSCPFGFQQIDNICYIETEKSTFPPTCPYNNYLPLSSLTTLITQKKFLSEPIWLPVTRHSTNGLDFMRWIEPSKLYQTEFLNYSYSGDIQTKNCIIFDNDGKSIAISCEEKHPGLCAYNDINSINNLMCWEYCGGYQSDYNSKTKCFCVEYQIDQEAQEAELLQYYQNNINFSADPCKIALQRQDDGRFYWTGSNQEINYTFWSSDVNLDDDNIYGFWTSNGWLLKPNYESCVLYEKEIPEGIPTVILGYEFLEYKFVLTVINSKWLQTFDSEIFITCTTDAKRDNLLYVFKGTNDTSSKTDPLQYIFFPIEIFPGSYWCEAFKFSNSEVIKTETLFFSNFKTYEFIAIFRVQILDCINPLSSEIFEYLNRTALSVINELSIDNILYIARLMKIEELNQENDEVVINVHLSSSVILSNDLDLLQEKFMFLQNLILEQLDLHQDQEVVEFLDLFSPHFCSAKTINYPGGINLTWPSTFADDKAFSQEFCFRKDGNLVTNLCSGDFLDGVNWSVPFFNCEILKPSSISSELVEFYNKGTTVLASEIEEILQIDIDKFQALDIYLLEVIFNNFFLHQETINLDLFRQALVKLVAIRPILLLESQSVAYSTDRILDLIDIVLRKLEPTEINELNFDFVVSTADEVTGLVVVSEGDTRKVEVLTENWDLKKLIDNYTNLEFGLYLSLELRNTLKLSKKIILKLFQDHVLFQVPDVFTYEIFTVFGIQLETNISTAKDQSLPGDVMIIQKNNLENNTYSCLKWVYELNNIQGIWIEEDQPHSYKNYQICSFWNIAHYTVGITHNENVTSELEDLLENSIADSDKMTRLANISEKHKHFKAVDIFLVGKILNLTKDNPDNNLTSMAKVIDNLHRTKREVLSESQQSSKATDLILDSIDKIATNCNLTENLDSLITTDHFLISVSNKESNLTGLLILESDFTYEVQTIQGDFSIADITSYQNFSSLIYISSDLRNQMSKDSKLIITFFFSDCLFNQNQLKPESISKIFGVIFSEIDNYTAPISIFHNISRDNNVMECSYWNYSTSDSFWAKDSEAQNEAFISRCDFWHTTHFALLLLSGNSYSDYDTLDWITTVNSIISFISILIIVLTAILFKKWRQNIGNQILLNFSFAIGLQIVTFYIAGTSIRHSRTTVYCTIIGVLLHYSVIAQFCWMLTIAILQFRRFVKVFATSPSYLLLKACVCGWVFPILPVMLALVLDNEEYVISKVGLCYPSGLGLYLGVWVPIGIIGIINLIIFIYIIYSVVHTKIDTVRSGRSDGKHQWRLFVLLFFMLGLTWIFGFLSNFNYGIIFAYLFCCTGTLQGFVLFLYFIVFNKTTRGLYCKQIKSLFNKKLTN